MNRAFAGILAASGIALAVSACDSDKHDRGGYGYAYRAPDQCRSYATCAMCTPADGCGWCFNADGSGSCASDPDECQTDPQFSWTWDPSGCRVTADASVVADDGGVVSSDAAASCEWPPNADTMADAGDGGAGCVPGGGGDLCTSPSEYALGCFGANTASIPAPSTSLGCKASPAPNQPMAAYYCCRCVVK